MRSTRLPPASVKGEGISLSMRYVEIGPSRPSSCMMSDTLEGGENRKASVRAKRASATQQQPFRTRYKMAALGGASDALDGWSTGVSARPRRVARIIPSKPAYTMGVPGALTCAERLVTKYPADASPVRIAQMIPFIAPCAELVSPPKRATPITTTTVPSSAPTLAQTVRHRTRSPSTGLARRLVQIGARAVKARTFALVVK
mmetsp:Transcript_2977/g.7272  ORF Transcript_2977/g.7272 Transcript_2977/m.7272 type:complete len:202 (+) Transcript_2977:285-890(+)